MKIKQLLGKIYHPILYEIRMNKSIKNTRKRLKNIQTSEFIESGAGGRIFICCTNYHKSKSTGGVNRVIIKVTEELEKLQTVFPVFLGERGFYYCTTQSLVKFQSGDKILILDIEFTLSAYVYYLDVLQKNQIQIFTFVHDLIALRQPNFSTVSFKRFKSFVQTALTRSDVIIANSKFVMNDVKSYMLEKKIKASPKFFYTHLGNDFPSTELSIQQKSDNKNSINFLMVSTVSPRKMYPQAVHAFDILRDKGIKVTLTIVGRAMDKNAKDAKCIATNKNLGKNLFWLSGGVSDEILQEQYAKADAVIFASVAEGFGLAITEASFYKKPLIIRDIEVFKEIAGNNAFYFHGLKPQDLASAIEEWILLYKQNKHPKSDGIERLSWADCAKNIYDILNS